LTKRKCLAIGIILAFVGTCIIPTIAQDTEKPLQISRGNWLYVGGSGPGNYTKIQDAVNDTVGGDTVFVYDDASPYLETVVINTSIRILGEEKNLTVIDAGVTNYSVTVSIHADNVCIENFSIWNSGWSSYGIGIYSSDNIVISEDIFSKNIGGVYGETSNHLYITENNFTKNQEAVTLYSCVASVISNNEFLNNTKGLIIDSAGTSIVDNIIKGGVVGIEINAIDISIFGNTVESCQIGQSAMGLFIDSETANTRVQYNIFNENDYGIFSFGAMNNNITISQNTFSNNTYGFSSHLCSRIRILQNNFIRNEYHAYFKDSWWFQANRWKGNYWDDYQGKGAKAIRGEALFFVIPLGYFHNPLLFYFPWKNYDRYPSAEPIDIREPIS
jgi:parallel beta-helix repeat protein